MKKKYLEIICISFIIFCSCKDKKNFKTTSKKSVEKNVIIVPDKRVKVDSIEIDTVSFHDITDYKLKLLYNNDSIINDVKCDQRIYKISNDYNVKKFDEKIMNLILRLYPSSITEVLGKPKLNDFEVLENFTPIKIKKEDVKLLVLNNNYCYTVVGLPDYFKIVGIYFQRKKILYVFYGDDLKIQNNGFIMIHYFRGNKFVVRYTYEKDGFVKKSQETYSRGWSE